MKKRENLQIGRKIREARISVNLSQEELARKIGVSNKTISAYEIGRAIPPLKVLVKISKVIGLSVEDFLPAKKAEKLERFFQIVNQAGTLKRIKRIGWLLKGITQPESVADHSFRTAFLALLLLKRFKLDELKVLKMALLTDMGKVYTGEKKWEKGKRILRSFKQRLDKEKETVYRLFHRIPEYKELIDLWEEFIQQKTKEARIVKQIDKLEMVVQALEYEREGYPSEWFDEFWENAEKYLKGQELEPFFNFLKSKREHERSH